MRNELRIVAPFHNSSGFASAGRALIRTARLAGFSVAAVESEIERRIIRYADRVECEVRPQFTGKPIPECQLEEMQEALATRVAPEAPTLLLQNPSGLAMWSDYCSGPRIGLTMLESDRLHPLWAQAARNVDFLLAPSRFCEETLQRDVPGVAIGRLPLPVDDRLWSPAGSTLDIPPSPLKGEFGRPSFLFGAVFSTCERKGWRLLTQAFAEELRGEDCGLVLKCNHGREVRELAEWCASMGAWVRVFDEVWTDEELASFYRTIDCYALPSCEGFGLPFIEAALCGRASIALSGGGAADAVDAISGYLVPHVWRECIGQIPQVYPSGQRMATAEIGPLRAALRWAFEHRKRVSEMGGLSLGRALVRFSPTALATRLRGAVMSGETLYRQRRSRFATSIEVAAETPPLVAIVTTHNELERTKTCVAAVQRHTPRVWVFLADDGSTDGTREWAKGPPSPNSGGEGPNAIVLVECDSGGNVSANRQTALKLALTRCPGRFVAFLDNDVEVGHGWWERLHRIFATHEKIGILATRKVYGDATRPPDPQFWGNPGDGERLQNVGNRLRFDGGSFPVFLERELVWADYVESACMVVRPEVAAACQWDPQFPIFYEDADFCFQARAAGWEIATTNSVTVVHHAHTTSTPRATETERNRKRFLVKWKERL